MLDIMSNEPFSLPMARTVGGFTRILRVRPDVALSVWRNEPSQKARVKGSQNAGFVLFFEINRPVDSSGRSDVTSKIEAYIKIYDIMGTIVAFTPLANLATEFQPNSTSKPFRVYWNGRSMDNRKLAPGVYRAMVFYNTSSNSGRLVGEIGVKW